MKRIIFIIIIVFLLLSTSCDVYDSYYGHADVEENWRYGTEGVEISFLNDKFVFYDGDYMRIQLVLQNKGAYDKPYGKIVLSGFDPSIVFIKDDEINLPDEFYGKNAYNSDGSTYFVEVNEDAPLRLALSDTYEANLQASVCYTYQTVATPTVCLLYNPNDNYICQQNTISLSSQGGPVAVVSVDQTYMQDKVRFTTTIQHVGDGTVLNAYDTDAYDACPFTITRDHLGYVGVKMKIHGLDEPSCVPANNYVKLNDKGQGVIVCTFTLREPESYTALMEITLDYSYLFTAEQDITLVERSSNLERKSSGTGVSGSSSSVNSNGNCYCSDANMQKWGGCICLYLNGNEYYCLEGSTSIPLIGNIGDAFAYQVRGSSTVYKCGDGPSPQSYCPFDGVATVSGSKTKLNIYGTTADGRTVSERCNLVLQ